MKFEDIDKVKKMADSLNESQVMLTALKRRTRGNKGELDPVLMQADCPAMNQYGGPNTTFSMLIPHEIAMEFIEQRISNLKVILTGYGIEI